MKTKKCGVYAVLAAVLLITAGLIASCVAPINPDGLPGAQKGNPEAPPPAGMGYLKLIIEGTEDQFANGRTIMPDTPTPYHYIVTGTPGGTGTAFSKAFIPTAGVGTILVEEGVYTIAITAYKSTGTTEPLAGGTATNVTVAAAPAVNSASVTLNPTKAGNGTFAWNLTGAAVTGADSITVTLRAYTPGTGITGTNVLTAGTAATGTQSVSAANLYWVNVVLSKTGNADVVKGDLVWIYDNITTTYEDVFAAFSPNVYTVTFKNGDNEGGTTTKTGVVHGSTLATSDAPADSTTTDPTGDDDIFDGWYKESTFETLWGFGSGGDKVVRNTTIYGQWVPGTGQTLTITLSFTISDNTLTLSSTSQTFNHTTLATNSVLEIVLTGLTGVRWYSGSQELTSTNSATGHLEIDLLANAYIDLLTVGAHPITITVGDASAVYTLTTANSVVYP